MKKITGFAALLMVMSGSAMAASAPACVTAEKTQIEGLFDKWNNSLQTGDAHKGSVPAEGEMTP
ncbi:hypothetical protein PS200_004100 [Salmonella enterica]|uniref:hypothetical protein n=1 Tax=Klebsiella pneumoniae TaxID=573 RepID=UPI002856566B|nr:hypothetical protein [Salmonella enterica]ELC5607145.1 hypothetical protein [Salmonella enterica]ELD2860041.1 hypothetical protein [Salmonella enterica]ELU8353511.1 hypothetical protein [Salmonella enterica]EMD1889289.1 hypothetical protein [Salmonella enterica subsp. enterica serovar Mbandaka]